ncbi:hypothetical protein ACFFRR_007615 [Megaselia abdita]
MFFILFSFVAVVFSVIFLYFRNQYKYFEDIGIEYDKATPILGTFKNMILQRESALDNMESVYNKFSSGIVGIFDMKNPAFLIRNPEVIRQVLIKDFDNFHNRRKLFIDDSLLGHSTFQLYDQKWKDMRSSMSPAFTGSKMRAMFELIRDIGEETVTFLKTTGQTELNVKDFLSRYANDVIATTAFGFQINSNKDPENEFFKMGQEVTSGAFGLKFLFTSNFSKIANFFKMDLITERQRSYYMKLILDTMKYRKDNKVFRPDLLNIIMEMREGQDNKKSSRHWKDVELVSQCFAFFFAAFDTVSSTMSFICQELMENQDCQDKLREEILEIADTLEGKPLSYEALTLMKYTDCVISEAMRKWPAAGQLDRICTKAIVLHDPETGKDVYIQKGDNIQISNVGLQRDPKYFPNPLKFDPERFNEENKKSINPNTLTSFGLGPRMCIGNRFAILEMKSLIYHLFKEFKFEQHAKSVVPLLKLDPTSPNLEPKGGFWVKLSTL